MHTCFFIMPFHPELNFFYLYIRKHLREKHGIDCERGDHKFLTIPLLEKIRKSILETDVIIADITKRNPNVFYELGLADAYGKKVILITQDGASDVPTDIKHLEFIKYDLSQDTEFIKKLDNALHHVFVDRYIELYERAKEVLITFNSSVNLNCEMCSQEEFQMRVISFESTQGIPPPTSGQFKGFLLPKIIKDNNDISIIHKMSDWISEESF